MSRGRRKDICGTPTLLLPRALVLQMNTRIRMHARTRKSGFADVHTHTYARAHTQERVIGVRLRTDLQTHWIEHAIRE